MIGNDIEFEKVLEDTLNSPTLSEVEKYGKLLCSKTIIGIGYRLYACLYEYKNQKYVVEYKHNTTYPYKQKECLRFGIV